MNCRLTAFPGRFGSTTANGLIGGVQAGYNQQFGMFVGGFEADISFLGNQRTRTSVGNAAFDLTPPLFIFPANALSVGTSSRLDWLGTLRLRGGLAIDRLMIYGTGGLAFGNPDYQLTVSQGAAILHTGSKNGLKTGWTLGAGAEYAFTDNLTMKAEYLYYDLGGTTVTARPTAAGIFVLGGTSVASGRFETRGHIARVGLNYKF